VGHQAAKTYNPDADVVNDPPVVIRAKDLQRFKLRLTDTGYGWNGALQITLLAGHAEKLRLPAMRIFLNRQSTDPCRRVATPTESNRDFSH
jgi:hypothetical protein